MLTGAGPLRPFARTGLILTLRNGPGSARVAITAGLAMGLAMSLADATLFRPVVPAVQHVLAHEWSLTDRLARFALGAVEDELVLRLGGLTLLLTMLVAWRGERTALIDGLAIGLTAAVLWPIWAYAYLGDLDWSGLTLAREILLHIGAGSVWGWLFCRHGWMAGVLGHVSAHLMLQPLLPWVVS
ncbi:hypothetical protein [Novosphingobium sp.]|uniref:hypothetical protein n=1 Tax=Novosphingobium sp. TaxID=1874826 RepID=UPI002601D616|nr:hypothetical protein [Novosphingobium sp.]